jgi:hypothetical protein
MSHQTCCRNRRAFTPAPHAAHEDARLRWSAGARLSQRPSLPLPLALALILACALAGCAMQPPRAWERDLLARPAMQLEDDPLGRRLVDQVHTSKENASGGGGASGGGCGCN